MSLKLKHLIIILKTNGCKIESLSKRIESNDLRKTGKDTLAKGIYRDLGGIKENLPSFNEVFNVIDSNIIISLDESLHFNRYRNITLKSEFYDNFPNFSLNNYRRYCRNYEKECLKAGLKTGNWSNFESDYYFGISSQPGDFFKNGAGGWKLLALKDFLEDVYWSFNEFKILRIAVYDTIMAGGKLFRIDSILERPNHPYQEYLLKSLVRRIDSLK
jgi:hypothetical protein